jgi:hypothetical protein
LLFEYPLETMLFVAFAIIVATFTNRSHYPGWRYRSAS